MKHFVLFSLLLLSSAFAAAEISIINLSANQSVRANNGQVQVVVVSTSQFILYLDDKAVAYGSSSTKENPTIVTLKNVDRGTHTIHAASDFDIDEVDVHVLRVHK